MLMFFHNKFTLKKYSETISNSLSFTLIPVTQHNYFDYQLPLILELNCVRSQFLEFKATIQVLCPTI